MSHEEAQRQSSTDSSDYGVFSSSRNSPTSQSAAALVERDRQAHRNGSMGSATTSFPPSGVAMAAPGDSRDLTPLQSWAVRASDSQFNALSGAIGGLTSGVVTCPLDVIKTKLQAQGGFTPVSKGRHVGQHKMYEGLVGTARVIWREEGIRGLYRGLGPIVLGYLPTWAVWFTVYNNCKAAAKEHHFQNDLVINFWSSIIAGASSTIVTNPIWVIKTRLMSQSAVGSPRRLSEFARPGNTPTSRPTMHAPWHYNSTFDAARKMYSSEGILSFYSGLTPALLGLSHVAVQFPAYEFLRKKFTGQGMGEMTDDKANKTEWLGVLSASVLSKVLASSATYPHEVIRTRLQTQRRPAAGVEYLQGLGITAPKSTGKTPGDGRAAAPAPAPKYKGVLMTFRTILREEGWRAFYAGMGVNMARAVPAATVTMMTYEYVMKLLNREKNEALRKQGLGPERNP